MVVWLAFPALLMLVVPFVTLMMVTPWHDFHLAYGDWHAVTVSLGLSAVSLPVIVLLGIPLALWLSRTCSHWRRWVEAAVMIPLLTPPLALGILLVSVYGPYGTLGAGLSALGISLTNNAPAFILAQLYGALPYFVMSARAAFENVPLDVEEAAKTLGASAWQIFAKLTLPIAARGLATGLSIAWGRAIGEFGIAMVFCYFPQGMPVKIFINLQNDGVDSVYSLLWLLLLVTLPFPLWCFSRMGRYNTSAKRTPLYE
jgi:molybdate/tungstate transport system permease protein